MLWSMDMKGGVFIKEISQIDGGLELSTQRKFGSKSDEQLKKEGKLENT